MAQFTINASLGISTDDGITIENSVTGVSSCAKHLTDDEFLSAVVIDFAPFIASITDPTWFILLADGDGVFLDFDGVGVTTKAFKSFIASITPNTPGPSGVLDLAATTQGAKQRIQFLAIGNE